MSKFFVKANQIYNNKIEILDEDVNHIKNVLRLEIGENIIICNQDDSTNYDCKITEITSKKVECEEDISTRISSTYCSTLTARHCLPRAESMITTPRR